MDTAARIGYIHAESLSCLRAGDRVCRGKNGGSFTNGRHPHYVQKSSAALTHQQPERKTDILIQKNKRPREQEKEPDKEYLFEEPDSEEPENETCDKDLDRQVTDVLQIGDKPEPVQKYA